MTASSVFTLTLAQASRFARLALDCIQRELPSSLQHVVNGPDDVKRPRELHPAFYGCLDWHSAVHGHWMLVRLLRVFPDLPEAAEIRAALDVNLTAANIAAELAYFQGAHRASYERPYGWAWLLQLAAELQPYALWFRPDDGADPDVVRWDANLRPLTREICHRFETFLPKQTYPVRSGVHSNTAFALSLALDYGRQGIAGQAFFGALLQSAHRYYGDDRDAPAHWEPNGEDFLSPALVEADLMRRLMHVGFPAWLRNFFPRGLPPSLQSPATVSDRSDGKLAHLDGLNLSRAWCMRNIAAALPFLDDLRYELSVAAERHAAAGLANVATGDYAGEHWLATFAVYLLTS